MDQLAVGLRKAEIFSHTYARRFRGVPCLGQDDLYGYACLGLAEAFRTYDASKAGWSTYCELRIRRAILQGIRGLLGYPNAVYHAPHPATNLQIEDVSEAHFARLPNQLELVMAGERAERIRGIVRSLPRKIAVATYLYWWKEMTVGQVGETMCCSESYAVFLVNKGIRMVAKRWGRDQSMIRRRAA